VARREGIYLHGELEDMFLERECIERKGGSRIYTKKSTVFVIWGDESLAVLRSRHACHFTLFTFLYSRYISNRGY